MTLDELARLAEAADEEYHAVFGAEARWSDNVFGDSDADEFLRRADPATIAALVEVAAQIETCADDPMVGCPLCFGRRGVHSEDCPMHALNTALEAKP